MLKKRKSKVKFSYNIHPLSFHVKENRRWSRIWFWSIFQINQRIQRIHQEEIFRKYWNGQKKEKFATLVLYLNISARLYVCLNSWVRRYSLSINATIESSFVKTCQRIDTLEKACLLLQEYWYSFLVAAGLIALLFLTVEFQSLLALCNLIPARNQYITDKRDRKMPIAGTKILHTRLVPSSSFFDNFLTYELPLDIIVKFG